MAHFPSLTELLNSVLPGVGAERYIGSLSAKGITSFEVLLAIPPSVLPHLLFSWEQRDAQVALTHCERVRATSPSAAAAAEPTPEPAIMQHPWQEGGMEGRYRPIQKRKQPASRNHETAEEVLGGRPHGLVGKKSNRGVTKTVSFFGHGLQTTCRRMEEPASMANLVALHITGTRAFALSASRSLSKGGSPVQQKKSSPRHFCWHTEELKEQVGILLGPQQLKSGSETTTERPTPKRSTAVFTLMELRIALAL